MNDDEKHNRNENTIHIKAQTVYIHYGTKDTI